MDLSKALAQLRERIEALLGFELDEGDPGVALRLDASELDLEHASGRGLLLGHYSEESARRYLEEDGFLGRIEEKVGGPLTLSIDVDAGLLRLSTTPAREGDPPHVVAEVKARLASLGSDEPGAMPRGRFLVIDWITFRRPGPPPPGWRPLPGQERPGLGLGTDVLRVIGKAACRLRVDGVIGVPMHYHNAAIYHLQFAFVDPAREGELQALLRDLAGLPFCEAAWAVDRGRVLRADGSVYEYEPGEMLLPLSSAHRAYLESDAYLDAAARALQEARFTARG